MRIAHRHRNALVSEGVLYGSQIRSGHDKATGECVPEIVPVEALDSCCAQSRSNQYRGPRSGPPWAVRINRARTVAARTEGQQGRDCDRIKAHIAALAVLTARDCQHPLRKVHVFPHEAVHFAQAQPGMEREVKLRHVLCPILGNHLADFGSVAKTKSADELATAHIERATPDSGVQQTALSGIEKSRLSLTRPLDPQKVPWPVLFEIKLC